jgi:hypothetical protein
MADEPDYALLREHTGTTESTLDDIKAAAIFERVEAAYAGNADAIFAAARVEVLQPIWARATELADYTQNEESEKLGQIADAKKELLDYWEGKLAEATAAAELPKGRRPAFFGLAKASNRRWYP